MFGRKSDVCYAGTVQIRMQGPMGLVSRFLIYVICETKDARNVLSRLEQRTYPIVSPQVDAFSSQINDPEKAHSEEATKMNGIKRAIQMRIGYTANCNAKRRINAHAVLARVMTVRNGTACSKVEYGTAAGTSCDFYTRFA